MIFFGQSFHFDNGIICTLNRVNIRARLTYLVPHRSDEDDLHYCCQDNVVIWRRASGRTLIKRLIGKVASLRDLCEWIEKADSIVFNGLFFPGYLLVLIVLLAKGRTLAAFAWGGDFYEKELYSSRLRSWAVSRLQLVGLGVLQDKDMFRAAYPGFQGVFCEFTTPLPASQYQFLETYYQTAMQDTQLGKQRRAPRQLEIMIGHSAHPSNNHLAVIERLAHCQNQDFVVTLMLTYGEKEYGRRIFTEAVQILGHERVKAEWQWMEPCEYLQRLSKVSIGVFDQQRQQAGKNILFLAAMGKPVFINPRNTMYEYLHAHSICCERSGRLEDFVDGNLEACASKNSIRNTLDLLSDRNSAAIITSFATKLISK